MVVRVRLAFICWLVIGFYLFTPTASAQERLCDPSFENCYDGLVDLIRKETSGIDMAFYMFELPAARRRNNKKASGRCACSYLP